MRSFTASLCAAAFAVMPALAETPMNAEEFEAHVEGRTLTFSFMGEAYGVEQYLPGRRVLWAFIGDACQEGIWYQREDMICFAYEVTPDEQCWHFYRTETGLRGVFVGADGPGTELYEVENSAAPMSCPGPGLGV